MDRRDALSEHTRSTQGEGHMPSLTVTSNNTRAVSSRSSSEGSVVPHHRFSQNIGLNTTAELNVRHDLRAAFYPVAKRSLDITVSCLALILLSPLALWIALFIWMEDRGQIFYIQTRVGKDGQQFPFYKFRSMVMNADALKAKLAAQNEATGPVFKMRQDPRITRIGRILRKTSLDELPQFWNVLRGDMSLVGPRPHLPSEVARYRDGQHVRLSVTPGLICLREISGRSNLTFDRWVETDLLYVQTRSLATDLKILWRAVPAVLKGDGAY